MKSVLVTGADGFIGSHLVELLVKKGYQVKALALYNSYNNWGWLEDVDCKRDLEIVSGDIRDSFFCNKISEKCNIIIHLAALIAIPYSYTSPESYIETNTKGTLNLCQAARINNIEHLIHTSTSEVYGTAKYIPIDESHPLQAQSPYSASKIAADSIASSFFNSYNVPITIARPFNTYGPRQSARAVIPTIITQILNGEKKIRLGDISPTRDFNFVTDTVRGILSLQENKDNTIGKTINIGSNSEVSIEDTFNLINKIIGAEVELERDKVRIRPKNSEVFRLCCDNKLIKDLTGFSNEITFEEGLRKTIHWISKPENLIKYKSNIYNV